MPQHVVGYSLIDISQTSALQMQNYNALMQTISLRGNPLNIRIDMAGNQPMSEYDFGENFGATQNIWIISFMVEQLDVFANKFSNLGGLEDDCHQVPVITHLMESITVNPAVFDTRNQKTKNLYFNIQDL
tara:strand:- start:13138 stop:13527 length:390 start_codon:yes stop_codon:yes gene_type:complete